MDSLLHFLNVTMAPANDFLNSLFSVTFEPLFDYTTNHTVSEMVGGLVGGVATVAGIGLLITKAFTGDEGFKTIKQVTLLALIPIGSLSVAQVVNFSTLETKMTAFFVIVRNLLFQWNFFLDVPLLFGLLTASFSLLGAYWVFKLILYFNDFFNQR